MAKQKSAQKAPQRNVPLDGIRPRDPANVVQNPDPPAPPPADPQSVPPPPAADRHVVNPPPPGGPIPPAVP